MIKLKYLCLPLCSILLLTACQQKGKKDVTKTADSAHAPSAATADTSAPHAATGKLAYIDLDTFKVRYLYWKKSEDAFNAQQAAVQKEMAQLQTNLQNAGAAYQKKVQTGEIKTEEQAKAEQQKLMNMQQALQTKSDKAQAALVKKQQDFNDEMQRRIDNYLAEYNKDKGYDFIFSYQKGGSFLYVNKALNITDDVVNGMNARDAGKK